MYFIEYHFFIMHVFLFGIIFRFEKNPQKLPFFFLNYFIVLFTSTRIIKRFYVGKIIMRVIYSAPSVYIVLRIRCAWFSMQFDDPLLTGNKSRGRRQYC